MPRRISALDSLGRTAWPWIVFNADGQAQARGATFKEAVRRAEHAEGLRGDGHRQFLVAKNTSTGVHWNRFRGSWWPAEGARAKA